jgi:glycosyltransferase involved in cell wall biosynthesis
MRVAVLVENWGEPWNEGYKNLAKYIVEAVGNLVNVSVISANRVKIPVLEGFDLIHIFNYSIPPHLFAYFARIRRPIIKHVAKKELDIDIRSLVRTLLNTKIVWDAFIVTTNTLREEIRRLAKGKPIFCVPPPIPTGYFKKLDKEECRQILGLEPDIIYLGYTGTLNRFRDLEVIARTLKLIKDRRVKLALSLTNITSRKLIELKKFLIMNRVKFIVVKDIRLFYSSVDLLVYPVEREGAVEPPLTLLEAMSNGCAVAAYKNMITSKLILDGYNGFLFSSTENLAGIINKLVREELDTETVSENARRTIIENYDASILRKSYVELYEKLINRRWLV